jgi:hypothetical protein
MNRPSPCIRVVLLSALALGALAGCGPLEFLASGISDGTKYLIGKAEREQQGQGAGTAPGAPAPARPEGAEGSPPVTAAPIPKVGPAEPIR